MDILEQVERSLADFRPRNPREFVALQLARRFNDVGHLAKYLAASKHHSKRALLAAAQTARTRHELNRAPLAELFFEVLSEWEQEGRPL
jgi:hypothetical protein